MSAEHPSLNICDRGHRVHRPAGLEEVADETGQVLGFCATCPCGGEALVVVWPGDGAQVWESDGTGLAADFEATRWPELAPPGPFPVRVLPALGPAMFSKRDEDRALFEELCRTGWE
ncbi:hypothetical protein ACIQBJ_06910 [Kitasatospora sp. NPDC088391]|uniref:hypothetical protein n=1 Tax=Kitasatospora sp. NPDC088391 TaxID=3364074 RepID=UPI00380D1E76